MKWLYIVIAVTIYMICVNYFEGFDWYKKTGEMEVIQGGVER